MLPFLSIRMISPSVVSIFSEAYLLNPRRCSAAFIIDSVLAYTYKPRDLKFKRQSGLLPFIKYKLFLSSRMLKLKLPCTCSAIYRRLSKSKLCWDSISCTAMYESVSIAVTGSCFSFRSSLSLYIIPLCARLHEISPVSP